MKMSKDKETTKKGDKNKHKRRHNYKYSGPVDEREVAEYDIQEAEMLMAERPDTEPGQPRGRDTPFYRRVSASLRRVMTCCFGKT